jgi:hypothetical protein
MSEPTQEQPAVTPTVSTAPERSRWHVSRIPGHLGRARTSTVVLVVLFLAIGALYLNIRPETTGTVTTGTGNQAPVSTTAPAREPTATTTAAPETTTDQPTTTAGTTTSGVPTDTTTPAQTTEPGLPTTSSSAIPTTVSGTPTVGTPTG